MLSFSTINRQNEVPVFVDQGRHSDPEVGAAIAYGQKMEPKFDLMYDNCRKPQLRLTG